MVPQSNFENLYIDLKQQILNKKEIIVDAKTFNLQFQFC